MLIIFGTAMAVSLGVESPLSYSVFSAASAAAAYAILWDIIAATHFGTVDSRAGVRSGRTQTHVSVPIIESEER